MSTTITIVPGVTEDHTITIQYPEQPETSFTVEDTNDTISIVEVGLVGPPGQTVQIPEFIQVVAGEILGGHRVVQIFDGIATYADKDTAYIGQLGLTMGAVVLDEGFRAFTSGIVEEPSWNFVIGNVFLGSNGLLTQEKPTTGTVVLVGKATSSTSIFLNFQQLYKRG